MAVKVLLPAKTLAACYWIGGGEETQDAPEQVVRQPGLPFRGNVPAATYPDQPIRPSILSLGVPGRDTGVSFSSFHGDNIRSQPTLQPPGIPCLQEPARGLEKSSHHAFLRLIPGLR